jgi:hypothetical protein
MVGVQSSDLVMLRGAQWSVSARVNSKTVPKIDYLWRCRGVPAVLGRSPLVWATPRVIIPCRALALAVSARARGTALNTLMALRRDEGACCWVEAEEQPGWSIPVFSSGNGPCPCNVAQLFVFGSGAVEFLHHLPVAP